MIENLETLGYREMTPVQAGSLPHVLKGEDLLAQAKTGSGKTAAFGIGLRHILNVKRFRLEEINTLMGTAFEMSDIEALQPETQENARPPMVTFSINGGRKTKLRPGDILGALTKDGGIDGGCVGKIDCFEFYSYVAVERIMADNAEKMLSKNKIKGRHFIVHRHE